MLRFLRDGMHASVPHWPRWDINENIRGRAGQTPATAIPVAVGVAPAVCPPVAPAVDAGANYVPFLARPLNPDGRTCRCGSPHHLTPASSLCRLNKRRRGDNGDMPASSRPRLTEHDSDNDVPEIVDIRCVYT